MLQIHNMQEETLNIAIFVIDDDENARFSLNALFKRYKITHYTIFSDPVKFLEAMHRGVQICVLDYDLRSNDFNGITLMQEVLKQNSYAKCIIMSGSTEFDTVVRFLNNGAFRYVVKGESNFADKLIEYIKFACTIVEDTFKWYKEVLTKTKETKALFNSA